MRNGDAENVLGKMQLNLTRHDLEVTLKRHKEGCFRAAKEIALESAEQAREMDVFVRKQYSDEPRKMAEWENIMKRYEFPDEGEILSDEL